jgi:hypothetical protein
MRPAVERPVRLRCGNARHGLRLAGFAGIGAPRGFGRSVKSIAFGLTPRPSASDLVTRPRAVGSARA